MLITVIGVVSRVDVIHLKEGKAVEFHIDTIYGEKEVYMVSDVVFRSKFREKFNDYESLICRKVSFKLHYVSNEVLRLVDCYLV